MNPWSIIPLVSCVTYAVLVIVILQQARRRVDKVFALFLAASAVWSFSAFMLTRNPEVSVQHSTFQSLIFWNVMVAATIPLVVVCYYHFVRVYNKKPGGIGVYIGYAITPVMLGLGLSGYVVKSAYMENGALHHDIGPWVYILMAIVMPYLVISIFMLARRYRSSIDPTDRNRTMYLMTGWSANAALGSITPLIPALAVLPIDHIGNLANALIISYTILRYRLFDIRFVARRGLAYFLIGASLIGIYIGMVILGIRLLPTLELASILLAAASIAVLLALAARPLRLLIQEQVDRLFHGETHIYRQALLDFSHKMGNILNLEEVANEMLPTICKALRLTQAKLLFQEIDSGDFTIRFSYPPLEKEEKNKLRFSADNPIVAWLTKEGKPLGLEQMAGIPQLKGLWATEREHLAASDSRLLCPIRSRGRLIGILALGKKQTNSLYYHEDLDLLMSMANQAGIVVENAQLYTQATTRANTDGLTDLYNHRHFHERLEQEIARGSRFGTMFSLIMLDIDFFKTYNDIYGHLAGDQNLRKLAGYVKGSIRNLDMAFRYGGEEFTIILPETRLDDAYSVAERIRKRVETKMSSKVMPLTVSIGVATWPADGVTKEEIIATADAALYRAKQTGRNRTCLSSDVVKVETPMTTSTDPLAQRGALSIIYALAATVDAKDHYTYGHSKKVSEYAVAIAEALKLPRDRIATIRAAALLHDIGKIGVPDSILNKQGPLTEAEWEPIKEHPQLGVEILRHVIDLVNCLPAILHHHEHYDGSGYPHGLQSNNIPLEARILAIADAYDAITSLRPYRRRLSSKEALTELKRCARTQFDPDILNVFLKLMEPSFSKELEVK
jgi:diguanylate cyclase (GGDEF)-like protein/putative nucleotidyltransferase with HDIG domain